MHKFIIYKQLENICSI